MQLLETPPKTSDDPKGRVLREWRLQLCIDPSMLATQACMSLSQLYELEDGGQSRFYSESLRRQAARRVAGLLGLDWDQIGTDSQKKPVSMSNVVPLQRPAVIEEQPQQNTQAKEKLRVTTALADEQAIPMGLAAPARETLLVVPPQGQFTPAEKPSEPSRSTGWSTFVALLLVVAVGAASGYAFAQYSPYRLYWPW